MSTEFFTKLIEALPVDIENGPWIAGGFPLSVYRSDDLFSHDIDYFFKNNDQYMDYVNKFKTIFNELDVKVEGEEEGVFNTCKEIMLLLSKPFNCIETDNSYTFSPNNENCHHKVQFIKKQFYNSLEDVFDDFDITACKIATDGIDFYASDETYHHIDNNILHINKFHQKSIKRFTKYVQYGFKPTKETIQGIYNITDPIIQFAGLCDY